MAMEEKDAINDLLEFHRNFSVRWFSKMLDNLKRSQDRAVTALYRDRFFDRVLSICLCVFLGSVTYPAVVGSRQALGRWSAIVVGEGLGLPPLTPSSPVILNGRSWTYCSFTRPSMCVHARTRARVTVYICVCVCVFVCVCCL